VFDADGRFKTKGTNTIYFKLDDTTASYDVFVMDSPGTRPRVFFDYGYRQTATDLNGKGFGDGRYYVKAGSELVLAPVLFLIGYKADYTLDTVSYAWSVSPGSYDTSKPHNGETFTFKPTASSTPTTYTVTVQVTGRNVITGLSDTKSASTEVVYGIEPKTSATTFNQPLKDFAPGQFTERGTGYGWSLGAVLGYEVWNAGTTVPSAKITGNGFESWNEPGVVWVQADDNGNGLPDETWYELPGSDDNGAYKNKVTRRYALTYYRDQLAETMPNQYDQIIRTIYWVDQRGRIGTFGGGWPSLGNPKGIQGVSGDWITYTGTLLRDSKGVQINLGQANLAPISGYVDVMRQTAARR
jgi:hypothetical protein